MKLTTMYVLLEIEFKEFASTIEYLKMPTRYSSILGQHIWKKKFRGLKLHDLPHIYAAIETSNSTGIAESGPWDGWDIDVQGFL